MALPPVIGTEVSLVRKRGMQFHLGQDGPTRYHKDGSEILISRGKNKNPRRLTPRECTRLMGFPDSYKLVVSDTRAYQLLSQAAIFQ